MNIKVKKVLVCILFIVLGMVLCYVFARNNSALSAVIMGVDGFIWATVIHKHFSHEWVKIDDEPIEEYWDYNGYKVGVFRCKCRKCGKIKRRKFY